VPHRPPRAPPARPGWPPWCRGAARSLTRLAPPPLRPQLPSINVAQEFITFKNVSLESDKYLCIRETGAQNMVVIVDMANPQAPVRRQISADSALMCIDKKVIALKATVAGTAGDNLQVFNLDTKQKLKAHQMPESVEFWKWITPTSLGMVTATSVFHWDIEASGAARRRPPPGPCSCASPPRCRRRRCPARRRQPLGPQDTQPSSRAAEQPPPLAGADAAPG
jgi:hypothetical protein